MTIKNTNMEKIEIKGTSKQIFLESARLVLMTKDMELESRSIYKESLQNSKKTAFAKETLVKLEIEILPNFPKKNEESCDKLDELDINETSHNVKKRSCDLVKTTRSSTRSFFQLRSTDPSIVFGFIDIVRQHPCQWNSQDYDFAHKDKRDESSKIICRELKDLFNICISPQLARSSILSLIRWFEREYLRSVQLNISKRGRWSRNGYVCAHPTYFNKLMEFIPYNHLQLLRCDKCHRMFKTQTKFLIHHHNAHEGDAPFKCHYCNRSFLYSSTWKRHENRHTKRYKWNCLLCGHISSTKTDYNLHMVTHTDIRAYVCDLCSASYKSSTSLNVHLRTHEPPRLECNICFKKFYENYRLKRHLLIHQAEASVKTNIKELLK